MLRRERGVARTVTGDDSVLDLPNSSGSKHANKKKDRPEEPDSAGSRGSERPNSRSVSESNVASESIDELQKPLKQSLQINQGALAATDSANGIYSECSSPAAIVANALSAPASSDHDELPVDAVFASVVASVPPGGVLKQCLGATADDDFSACSPPVTVFGNVLSEPASSVCNKFAGSRESQPLADGGV